jgi:N-acetylglucosamine transport system permease protein
MQRPALLRSRWSAGRAVSYVVVGAWSLFTVFFVAWIVLASLKKTRELFSDPWGLPTQPAWSNYAKVWVNSHFGDYAVNSLLLVSVSVLMLVVVCVPAAYVLARARFRGRQALTDFFVLGLGVPLPLLFVPLVVIMGTLRLGDSLTGLSLVYVALSIPFTIYVLVGFFSSLPSEFEWAARLDGCSDFQTFRHVMVPLALPGIATVSALNFVGLWNEYQLSLLLLNSPENRTLSLGIYSLISSMQYSGGDWPGLFAGVTMVMLPTLVLFIGMSERMISGITMGGIK